MSCYADSLAKLHPGVACPACRSGEIGHVWSDHLRETPAIFECRNSECPRHEFRVLRLNDRIVHCGTPGRFKPHHRKRAAHPKDHRPRAMENLPPLLDWAIRNGRLRGVERV